MTFTKSILGLTIWAMSFAAWSESLPFQCVADQYVVSNGGLTERVQKPLTPEFQKGSAILLTADIGERHYSVSGDLATGEFLLNQSWGPDYTQGMVATGSFNPQGRMSVTWVDKQKVFKLICTK